MGYRIGIDVGGTFTDLVCVTPTGEVRIDKTPSTLDDQSRGVMTGLTQLAAAESLTLREFLGHVDVIVHGTTTADNTMIEMDGAKVGLLVTEGHRDEIEMRRVHKEQIWDPSYPAPTPIARRRARIPIPERRAVDGRVLLPLDEDAVRAGVRRLRALGCDSLAVVFLFSFVDSTHELRARDLILEEFPDVGHVSLSHEVMPAGPEFERTSTTLVNAFVAPRLERYVNGLASALEAEGYAHDLLVMASTGGVMTPAQVGRRAVTLLGSGPTGGVTAAARAAGDAGVGNLVSCDMGGTSFDICLVAGGRPRVATDWNWRYRYYIGMPMVDVQCVGAGGGSIARVRQGALLVGPDSAGSTPGPACYGRGGEAATVTDADLLLGYIPAVGFAGGRMTLDVSAARAAVEHDVAGELGVDVIEAAWGIERIVNANMANATRRMLAGVGADPREMSLVAYGGNGPVHAWAIAAELGMSRVLVPRTAPAFSALGLLVADHVIDRTHTAVSPIGLADASSLETIADELEAGGRGELAPVGLPSDRIVVSRYLQVAYAGQNFAMSVPITAGPIDLEQATHDFHALHEADRGFSFPEQEPAVRGVRVVVVGRTDQPPKLGAVAANGEASDALTGSRPAYFGVEFVDTPTFDGTRLGAGATIEGPALIDEPFTVVVIPPGATCVLGHHTCYEMALGGAR